MGKYVWKSDKRTNQWPPEIYKILHNPSIQPNAYNGTDRIEIDCPIHGTQSRRICDMYTNLNNGVPIRCPLCARIESAKKTEQTNLTKYGTKTPAQNAEVLEKMKKTNLERYGVPFVGSNKSFQDRIKQSNQRMYGVDYAMQRPEVKEKAKQTMQKTYGTEHALQNPTSMQKFKTTMTNRHGAAFSLQSPTIQTKMRQTMQKTYGTEHALQNEKIKEAFQHTIQDRYGVDHMSQTYETYVQTQVTKGYPYASRSAFTILRNKDLFTEYICALQKDGPVTIKRLSDALGFSASTIGQYLIEYELQDRITYLAGSSYGEYELIAFFEEYGIKTIHRHRILDMEIDVYLPEYSLGIEFNGLYWHSDAYKPKRYHFNKTMNCKTLGITLIHIYEDEWNDERIQPILKSILLSGCNYSKNKRIEYARNLAIVELPHDAKTLATIKTFYMTNHLQGYRNASIHIGLINDQEELIECMSFGYPFYGNKSESLYQYELIRHCTKSFHNVVGGKERIFKQFLKRYPKDSHFQYHLVTYCDIDKFTGTSYLQLGFEWIGHSIQVWGIEDGYTRRINRNPKNHVYFKTLPKIYGCGNYTYRY